MDRDIRMKGKGTVHFIDEQRRPRELKGTIIVDYRSMFQPPYVKVLADKEYLMPFSQVIYVEWDIIEP
jgi:hypothetical protein